MYEPKDIFDRNVCAGDYITYGVKGSTDIHQVVAKVLEVIEVDPNFRYNRFQLKVLSYSKPWSWEKDKSPTYKTTLTSNKTIVRLTEGSLPLHVVEALNATIV